MAGLFGSMLGSLGSLVSNIVQPGIQTGFGILSQNHSAELQKDLQRDQAKIQDQYQRDLMRDQYSLMKSSLQDAGFSAAAASAGGFGSIANSNVTANASSPGMVLPSVDIAGTAQALAQTSLLQEEARGKRIDNDNKQTVIDLNNRLTEATAAEKIALRDLHVKELAHVEKQIEKADSEIRNLDQDTRTKAAQEFDLIASGEIRYEDLNVRTQLALAQIAELEAKAKLDNAQASECYKLIAKMSEEISLLQQQGQINDKELMILDNSIRSGKLQTDLLEKYGEKEHINNINKLYYEGKKLQEDTRQISDGTIEVGLPFGLMKSTYSPGSNILDVIFGDDKKSGSRYKN